MNKGSFKKLIRNLRKKSYEKVHFVKNTAIINERKEGEKRNVRSDANTDSRQE